MGTRIDSHSTPSNTQHLDGPQHRKRILLFVHYSRLNGAADAKITPTLTNVVWRYAVLLVSMELILVTGDVPFRVGAVPDNIPGTATE